MIITICLPPPPAVTRAADELPTCRSFSDLQHAREWMEKHGIAFPCDQDWRWP